MITCSAGGIAGNASHDVPLPEFIPFDPVEIAMRAASSSAEAATRAAAPSADAELPPPDAPAACPSGVPDSAATPDDIIDEAPGMDLDLVHGTGRVRGRKPATRDPKPSRKTQTSGIVLASGRICHRLSDDIGRSSPMTDSSQGRPSGCDIPGGSIGEFDSDMRDLARLFDVHDRPQGVANIECLIAAIDLVGGDGRAYRREHAKAARAIIAEVYSPPRVTAAA